KPSSMYVYGFPVLGFTVGPKLGGPNPAQTGVWGVISCVRSTYLAPFNDCSYVAHSGYFVPWRSAQPHAAMPKSRTSTHARFMSHLPVGLATDSRAAGRKVSPAPYAPSAGFAPPRGRPRARSRSEYLRGFADGPTRRESG